MGSAAHRAYLNEMEQPRLAFNRQIFLGLTEPAAHFAYYPPSTGYQKHLDSFQNDNLRRVSIVSYLNSQWRSGDGGELLIYQEERIIAEVPPLGGTLVCFVSEDIPHQVAVTHHERSSIAGWFQVRALDTAPLHRG